MTIIPKDNIQWLPNVVVLIMKAMLLLLLKLLLLLLVLRGWLSLSPSIPLVMLLLWRLRRWYYRQWVGCRAISWWHIFICRCSSQKFLT
jgi:hypothetical protein